MSEAEVVAMRAVVVPDTPSMRQDLVGRLLATELEVVALIRLRDRAPGERLLDLSVYGVGMLSGADLLRAMAGADVVYQDVYSFASLRRLPDEDDLFEAAWASGGTAEAGEPHQVGICEEVHHATDATVRLHLWVADGSGAAGGGELDEALVTDPSLRRYLRNRALEITLILPRRVSRMQQGVTLQTARGLRGVVTELIDFWADLRAR